MPFNQINQFYGRGPHKWEEYLNGTKNYTLDFNDVINEMLNSTESYYENNSTNTINITDNNEIQRLEPLCVIIFVTICYSIISLAGLLGNVITCIVISKNKSMHTATNYYLFNLAVSDLTLLLTGMPQEIYNMWFPNRYDFPETFCVLRGLLSETSTNATVLTIASFTIERYIAICHPFRQHTMSKLSRAVKFIMVVWIVAFCFAVPQAMQFVVVSGSSGKSCTVKAVPVVDPFYISTFCFFVVPMTLICVLYILIGIKLKNSKTLHGIKRDNCEIAHSTISSQTRIIRMLIAVVVAFFLCWAPFHAQRLAAVYGNKFKRNVPISPLYIALTHISGILYFMSTCINPLLYSIMSHKFRNAFKITIMKHVRIGTNCMKPEHTYSMLSRYNGLGSIKMSITASNNQRNSNPYISDIARIEIGNIQNDTTIDSTYAQIPDECTPMSTNNNSALQMMNTNDKITTKNNKNDLKTKSKLRTLNEKNRRQKFEMQRIQKDSKRQSNRSNNHNNNNNCNKKSMKIEKTIPKITSNNSIWSASTISNTSLQEYDTELNSEELAKYMKQINNEIRH